MSTATKKFAGKMAVVTVLLLPTCSTPSTTTSKVPDGFTERFAEVNGVRLHYFIGGKGSPVVLLHGYTQTSHMWLPLMPLLAQRHTVIAPDLRGAGDSSKPESGYDKKNMAVDIHDLASSLGFQRVSIVGHDIGLMVAYAYAAQFPQATERVVLMDAFLPGIGNWKDVWLMRDLWHFHFYGEVPLALVKGRERTYFEHFWNDFAADAKHSVSEADRRFYAEAYTQPGGMRAGFEYFRNFERDAKDFAQLSAKPLPMPVLVLTGEKASGNFLIEQAKLVASHVRGQVVMGSGHWLMEEAPQMVIPAIIAFIDEPDEIKDAFLDLPLPSPDGKRVTILFHPGRVKSGVGANLAFGRALHAGSTVTLIRGPDRRRLAGEGRLESGETVWRFIPARPWRAGTYAVVTHPDLEDSAGNRPCAPFEASEASQVPCEEGTVQTFELSK